MLIGMESIYTCSATIVLSCASFAWLKEKDKKGKNIQLNILYVVIGKKYSMKRTN